jgi:hypothetical protein
MYHVLWPPPIEEPFDYELLDPTDPFEIDRQRRCRDGSVVPGATPAKCRPIGIYPAPGWLDRLYREDSR